MKKLLAFLFLFTSFLLPVMASAAEQNQQTQGKIDAYVFTAPSCIHCIKMKKEFLPQLKKKYKDRVNFIELDVTTQANNLRLIDLAKKYNSAAATPAFVVGNTYLLGYQQDIGLYAEAAIEQALNQAQTTKTIGQIDAKKSFREITFAAIVINGLIDGINPCAFAVIVFFVSFLTVYGYNRKEVFYVGAAYCAAVFLTYVLLGLGLFKILYTLQSFQLLIKIFYLLTALVCFVFFALSIYDFIVYQKTKNSKAMLLQLPAKMKTKMNKIIGFFLRDKEKTALRLTLAAFVVGFVISLVEAACTGQIYVPTIVLILKEPAFRVQAFAYLIVYNLMFIMPLLAVFIFSALGHKSEKINTLFKKNLGLAKLLLALVFLGLGIMIFLS
ncbi:MAG: hypothetical protein LBM71_05305 [Elusimicrobiota bacterium]|jgi:cytochrome c biogenesis protein CcdA|nr:hypothetical protein [Elusimicrobiota bacterium]